jgi:hypothetical protein
MPISEVVTFESVGCCQCGITFMITDRFKNHLIRDGSVFYCPNGHSQSFGESEAQKVRKELARERASHDQAKAEIATLKTSETTLKGTITKITTRVANGVCSCCNRSFVNLQRHMKTKHPEFKMCGHKPK